MIAFEQLCKFCADADDILFYLRAPWKDADGRIMASNGHIAVLLDAGADMPEVVYQEKAPSKRFSEWAAEIGYDGFSPALAEFDADKKCKACDGIPHAPTEDDDDWDCACYLCDGTGFAIKEPLPVGNAHYAKHYLRLIASLPAAEFKANGPRDKAQFRFDGGVGFLMPVRVA